ncbi:MAG: class II aldolase/adducin family protein [Actinobacteria bacterium]|nr:class II aldolase/adducin family protein [Actinomycetota bacterium]
MTDLASLIATSRVAGEPGRHLAIAAEGNISLRASDDSMWIKASGCSLATLGDDDVLLVDRAPIRALLDDPTADDAAVTAAYASCVIEGQSGRRPSVEALLHGVLYDTTDAACILHTHPIAVNRLLCSVAADALVAGAVFPDQIVMLGQRQLLVPYVDPGLPLAREVRTQVQHFTDEEGAPPTVVYLRNHGVFVMAPTPEQALAMTEMCVKVASVIEGALAVGGPVYLDSASSRRIETRPDEHYRRRMLDGSEGR